MTISIKSWECKGTFVCNDVGTTLRENQLSVIEDVLPISARLIANRASYKFKQQAIDSVSARMAALLGE